LLEVINTDERIRIRILPFKGRQDNAMLCADNTKLFFSPQRRGVTYRD